jgi:hypothetical protein
MAVINDITEILHRIRANRYPNYLHGVPGGFIAEVTDVITEAVNESLTPGGMFSLVGINSKSPAQTPPAGCTSCPRRTLASGRKMPRGRLSGSSPGLPRGSGRWRW